jgi:uncharacterized protein YjbJ (UPF0337 family)
MSHRISWDFYESGINERKTIRSHSYPFHARETKAYLNCITAPLRLNKPENILDKNRTEGTKHEIKGAVKEVIGKVTGNKAKEVAGTIEKNAGKVQNEVGKAADKARDAQRKR